MKIVKRALVALWNEEEGLTTVEYAIAGALVSVAVAGAFTNLGSEVAAVLTNIITIITPAA